ncbi:hypothetical protein CVT26_010435 [Gymnopilus dilepis]|uniref:Uncharacterized protein n=1 Tax=Gymnopilus dilepis TaxID=231916 RepID=A0A409Y0I7_9AGAR|nr:hypothetical protein CVT26_010435 [Gymnopilus dilepis]
MGQHQKSWTNGRGVLTNPRSSNCLAEANRGESQATRVLSGGEFADVEPVAAEVAKPQAGDDASVPEPVQPAMNSAAARQGPRFESRRAFAGSEGMKEGLASLMVAPPYDPVGTMFDGQQQATDIVVYAPMVDEVVKIAWPVGNGGPVEPYQLANWLEERGLFWSCFMATRKIRRTPCVSLFARTGKFRRYATARQSAARRFSLSGVEPSLRE